MKVRLLLTTAALTLVTSVALAGLTQPAPVLIDIDNGFAQGDMRTAREADNDFDFIGCGVRQFDDGTFVFASGFCQAQDADEIQITCFTQSPALLETMRATADYSFITFSWVDVDDGTGNLTQECIRVGFSTQSFYLPAGAGGADDDSSDDSSSDDDGSSD